MYSNTCASAVISSKAVLFLVNPYLWCHITLTDFEVIQFSLRNCIILKYCLLRFHWFPDKTMNKSRQVPYNWASFENPDIYTVSLSVLHYKSLNAYVAHSFTFILVSYCSYCKLDAITRHAIAQYHISHHSAVRRDGLSAMLICDGNLSTATVVLLYVSWIVCYMYYWGFRTMFISRFRNQLNGTVYAPNYNFTQKCAETIGFHFTFCFC